MHSSAILQKQGLEKVVVVKVISFRFTTTSSSVNFDLLTSIPWQWQPDDVAPITCYILRIPKILPYSQYCVHNLNRTYIHLASFTRIVCTPRHPSPEIMSIRKLKSQNKLLQQSNQHKLCTKDMTWLYVWAYPSVFTPTLYFHSSPMTTTHRTTLPMQMPKPFTKS